MVEQFQLVEECVTWHCKSNIVGYIYSFEFKSCKFARVVNNSPPGDVNFKCTMYVYAKIAYFENLSKSLKRSMTPPLFYVNWRRELGSLSDEVA